MMHSREIIKLLEADGWYYVGTTGDHWHFKHHTKSGKITVVHPRKDNPEKLIRSIEKQSGIKLIKRG